MSCYLFFSLFLFFQSDTRAPSNSPWHILFYGINSWKSCWQRFRVEESPFGTMSLSVSPDHAKTPIVPSIIAMETNNLLSLLTHFGWTDASHFFTTCEGYYMLVHNVLTLRPHPTTFKDLTKSNLALHLLLFGRLERISLPPIPLNYYL